MYILLIMLPLINSIVSGLFGRRIGLIGSSHFSLRCISIVFFISVFILYEVSLNASCVYLKAITWLDSGVLHLNWGFLFDSLTAIMSLIISFVSLLVHVYSIEYMSHDPHLPRFMSYLSLFTFFMLILVTADNFIQMFVGWEGVGLCSFLLINFWYTRIQANKAAIKAMVINRVGDVGLIIGILFIFLNYKTLDYLTVFSLTPFFKDKITNFLFFNVNLLSLISLLLFIGVIGKSAQLGLHTWLPDAMEGPTPVSALIHAATMVTAGVFLLARCSPIYEFTTDFLYIVAVFGSMTSFFAATVGLLQNDVKKVIAYSTCSQLGYMVFISGLSSYQIGIFHLVNHAFFKALLFLGAGSVIHAISDEQDMRKMGGLKKLLPFTYSTMLTGSLALIGFPFLTGFYSKDIILEAATAKFTFSSYFCYYLGSFSALLTTFYSIRLLFLVFLSNPNGYRPIIMNAFDSSHHICFVLCALAFPSIFIGFVLKDLMIGLGSTFWGNAIFNDSRSMHIVDSHFISIYYKVLPTVFSLCILVLSFFFLTFNYKFLFLLKTEFLEGKKIFNFLNKKWFFDKLYNEYVGQTVFKSGYSASYKIVDRGILEVLGPTGFSFIIKNLSLILHGVQTKYLYHYLLIILIVISLFLSVLQLWHYFLGAFLNFHHLLIFMFAFFFLVKKGVRYPH